MFALTTVIPRHVTPPCMKHHALRGFISIKHVYKDDTLVHVVSKKQHNNGLLCSEKKCVMIIRQTRSIHQRDVLPQTFFPQYTKDNVPRDYEMIYQSNKGSKHVTMMLLTGPGAMSYLGFIAYWFLKFFDVFDYEEVIKIPVLNYETPMIFTCAIGTLGVWLLLTMSITFKFGTLPVRRVYESADKTKYIGIFQKLPWTSQRIEFSVKDIETSDVGPGSIMHRGNATIKGKHCLFYASDFKSPSYYNKLFGYDTTEPAKD